MQHTTKYQLNLIETSDPFSPAPLNENMEKVEEVIQAETAALDARLQVFEARHIAIGTFIGKAELTIDLGFTPRLVFVQRADSMNACYMLSEYDKGDKTRFGQIVSGGFYFPYSDQNYSVNRLGSPHCYLALD